MSVNIKQKTLLVRRRMEEVGGAKSGKTTIFQ